MPAGVHLTFYASLLQDCLCAGDLVIVRLAYLLQIAVDQQLDACLDRALLLLQCVSRRCHLLRLAAPAVLEIATDLNRKVAFACAMAMANTVVWSGVGVSRRLRSRPAGEARVDGDTVRLSAVVAWSKKEARSQAPSAFLRKVRPFNGRASASAACSSCEEGNANVQRSTARVSVCRCSYPRQYQQRSGDFTSLAGPRPLDPASSQAGSTKSKR